MSLVTRGGGGSPDVSQSHGGPVSHHLLPAKPPPGSVWEQRGLFSPVPCPPRPSWCPLSLGVGMVLGLCPALPGVLATEPCHLPWGLVASSRGLRPQRLHSVCCARGGTCSGSRCCWAPRDICRSHSLGGCSPGCTPGWDAPCLHGLSPGRSGSAVPLPVFPWAVGRRICCPGGTIAAPSLLAAPLHPPWHWGLNPPAQPGPVLSQLLGRRDTEDHPVTPPASPRPGGRVPRDCPGAAGARSPAGRKGWQSPG